MIDAGLLSITVEYPAAMIFDAYWLVWFAVDSLVGTILAIASWIKFALIAAILD